MRKALLVIDMQNFSIGKNHAEFFKYDKQLINTVNDSINNIWKMRLSMLEMLKKEVY